MSQATLKKRALGLGAVDFGRSPRKNKKYFVELPDGERIHFGHSLYSDFTEHRDRERQRRYLARASRIRDKSGNLTVNNPRSSNFWAIRLLWT